MDIDLKAKQLADMANQCCHRTDGYEEELYREIKAALEACATRPSPVNDEIIAELWHKAGGHLHRFARLLEQFMVKL